MSPDPILFDSVEEAKAAIERAAAPLLSPAEQMAAINKDPVSYIEGVIKGEAQKIQETVASAPDLKPDALLQVAQEAIALAQTKKANASAMANQARLEYEKRLTEVAKNAVAAGDATIWEQWRAAGMTNDTRDRWEATISNVSQALQTQGWGKRYGYDNFKQQIMSTDWTGPNADQWMPLRDVDYTACRIALAGMKFAEVGADTIRNAIHLVAELHKFDSAQIWLSRRQWDGVGRIGTFFERYCGAEATEYTRACGRYLWSAAAGRVLLPGCQADMVPVLISETQGLRKTRGIEAMNPGTECYTTVNLAERDADLSRKLRGRLIVELDELRGMRAKEIEAVKSWITQRSDTWRQTYHEFMMDAPRRFVMIGTTNEFEFLDDPTGARRWLPIVINRLDSEAIERDRDQLWAEGAALFVTAIDPKPVNQVDWRDAERLAGGIHASHTVSDDLEPSVTYALSQMPAEPFQLGALTFRMGIDIRTCGRPMEVRIGKILRHLGYGKRDRRHSETGRMCKYWEKSVSNDPGLR
jgi:predicted P-loop ATPase